MRTEQEVFIADVVKRHRKHLVEMGRALIAEQRLDPDRNEFGIGTVLFSKLLEGCLLTLAYSGQEARALCIVDWRFTDPACN